MAQPLVEPDSRSETAVDIEDASDQALPSLGYLDEALSFIAAERARWRAARQLAGGTASDSHVADDAGSEDEAEALEDDIGVASVIGTLPPLFWTPWHQFSPLLCLSSHHSMDLWNLVHDFNHVAFPASIDRFEV